MYHVRLRTDLEMLTRSCLNAQRVLLHEHYGESRELS